MNIKIVVDSISDMPSELINKYGINVMPLIVRFGEDEYKDGVELKADDFYKRVASGEWPATSVPAVGEFAELYKSLSNEADGIISIHVSSKLSGTYNSAVQGSAHVESDIPIKVVDSKQASMGIGMLALVAAKAIENGDDLETVYSKVNSAIPKVQCFALLDTLEYLQRGGRLGKGAALIGGLLNFKPILRLSDGEVHPFARPRSRRKGINKLVETAMEFGNLQEAAVMYSTDSAETSGIIESLSTLTPDNTDPLLARMGPGLGTHAGPGALGIALLTN